MRANHIGFSNAKYGTYGFICTYLKICRVFPTIRLGCHTIQKVSANSPDLRMMCRKFLSKFLSHKKPDGTYAVFGLSTKWFLSRSRNHLVLIERLN